MCILLDVYLYINNRSRYIIRPNMDIKNSMIEEWTTEKALGGKLEPQIGG